jgi:hypothetical protein
MLAWWTQILPVFLFKRLARWKCGRIQVNGDRLWAWALPDVLVKTDEWAEYIEG